MIALSKKKFCIEKTLTQCVNDFDSLQLIQWPQMYVRFQSKSQQFYSYKCMCLRCPDCSVSTYLSILTPSWVHNLLISRTSRSLQAIKLVIFHSNDKNNIYLIYFMPPSIATARFIAIRIFCRLYYNNIEQFLLRQN